MPSKSLVLRVTRVKLLAKAMAAICASAVSMGAPGQLAFCFNHGVLRHGQPTKALGGSVSEREGSRVRIELKGEQWRCHRPHPGKEAKRYQVEQARELLERVGVQP